MRAIALLLTTLLALGGCSTTRLVTGTELRKSLHRSREHFVLVDQEGERVRLDPNSELRFVLRSGEITPWVRASRLWRSELGLSFEDGDGALMLGWQELAGAELKNLSGGKTAAAIVISASVVALIVAVVAAGKGGGGFGGLGGVHVGGGRRRLRGTRHQPRRAERRLRTRGPGGVHMHVPLWLAAAPPMNRVDDRPLLLAGQGPPLSARGVLVSDRTNQDAVMETSASAVAATRLFGAGIRRRSTIQLVGSASAGTELVRFGGYAGAVYAGLRIRNAFEFGGGVRHLVTRATRSAEDELRSNFVGFGRLGAHLFVDNSHICAIALSADVGAGQEVGFHLKLNAGLRFQIGTALMVGIFPFSPSFFRYKESSTFAGAMRWTFPTNLEVGFNF